MKEKVAILGASDKPDRYAHKAFQLLRSHGHDAIPVSPKLKELEGVKAYASLKDIPYEIDTLTMYVGAAISDKLGEDILQLKPKRVIFNPGSENAVLEEKLRKAGVQVVEACTLVMLRTNQY